MLLISNFYPVLQQPSVGWKTRGLGFFFFPFVYSAVTQGSPGIEDQMLGLQNHLKPPPRWCGCSVTKLQPRGLQHARLPWPSLSPRVCSSSCPLSQWYHPTISFSVVPFSSCLQSFPISESFLMSRLFTSGGQSVGASASVLPMNIQDWFPLRLTGLMLQPKGLSRVFSNTTVQKHQFFGAQPSSQSNSHIHTWPQEKP